MWMAPPIALVFPAQVSHIIPGPRRGYLKELIRVLITLELSFGPRCGKRAFLMALPRDKPLIRCAAQSAEISRQLIPQTFSVYLLKKVLKRRLPNWLLTQSSKFRGSRTGMRRAFNHDKTQRADLSRPSFNKASTGRRG